MNKHHRIGKLIRGESPTWRQQHKAASNVFFRGLAKALIEAGAEEYDGREIAEKPTAPPAAEVTERPTTTPQPKGQVWVLSQGERYEGGHVVGVYADKSAGVAAATQSIAQTDGSPEPTDEDEDGVYWNCGIDYWVLRRYDVR